MMPVARPPKPQVLVIDDAADVRLLIAFWLSSLGCDVRTAGSGIAAQREIERQVPDVIFLDVVLPGLNGFEICSRLKQHALTRDIPVVMISGLRHPENVRRAREVGASHYLTKPIDDGELTSVIDGLIGREDAARPMMPDETPTRTTAVAPA